MSTAETHVHDTHHVDSNKAWDGGQSPFNAPYGKIMIWYFLLSDAFTFAGFLIAYGALRFSMPTWPVPDFVFKTAPFIHAEVPLLFVTFMTFVLIVSSVTMVRAVQEGHAENPKGVAKWMALTIVGGAIFLGCQAWEWTNLISGEGMTIYRNPFSAHVEDGTYLSKTDHSGNSLAGTTFKKGDPYLITYDHATSELVPGTYKTTDGETKSEQLGPRSFGTLFFFITGFHGFHVFSGLVFLLIIMTNASGMKYMARKNGHEMVEKVGLYWHFVDLVWVFVFLAFYLI